MPKIKTKTNLKTARPQRKKSEAKKMTEKEIEELQDIVLSKPDATAKPKLHNIWPVLLVSSILTCIGIPFIPAAERLLLGSFVACAAIWSTYKIFRYEKEIHQWYIDNPEFAKKKNKNKTRRPSSKNGKPVRVKI